MENMVKKGGLVAALASAMAISSVSAQEQEGFPRLSNNQGAGFTRVDTFDVSTGKYEACVDYALEVGLEAVNEEDFKLDLSLYNLFDGNFLSDSEDCVGSYKKKRYTTIVRVDGLEVDESVGLFTEGEGLYSLELSKVDGEKLLRQTGAVFLGDNVSNSINFHNTEFEGDVEVCLVTENAGETYITTVGQPMVQLDQTETFSNGAEYRCGTVEYKNIEEGLNEYNVDMRNPENNLEDVIANKVSIWKEECDGGNLCVEDVIVDGFNAGASLNVNLTPKNFVSENKLFVGVYDVGTNEEVDKFELLWDGAKYQSNVDTYKPVVGSFNFRPFYVTGEGVDEKRSLPLGERTINVE